MESSLSLYRPQQVVAVPLFQLSWVYNQAAVDPIHSVPPMLLPRQQLLLSKSSPHHCLLLLEAACCFCQEAASHNFASPLALFLRVLTPAKRRQVSTLQVSPVPVFVVTSPRPCGAASCSCEPELPTGTTSLSWEQTPLWHGFCSSLWNKSLLLQA